MTLPEIISAIGLPPFYKDEYGVIYCDDCRNILPKIPEKSIDLVVTSPPYNMGSGKSLGYQPKSTCGQKFYEGFDDDMDEEQYAAWSVDTVRSCLRVSRYVFWNVQFVRSTRYAILSVQSQIYDRLKDVVIWKKQAVANITARDGGMARGWEYVFAFGEDDLSTFPYNDFPNNGYVPNIQEWYKSESFREHHATFPVELPTYFSRYFCKTGDWVLDPFLGSGTTAVAAKQLGRKFIGIEISEKYCKIAVERLKQRELAL